MRWVLVAAKAVSKRLTSGPMTDCAFELHADDATAE